MNLQGLHVLFLQMWQAYTGQLPDCWPPAAISVPLLNRAAVKNMMEELTGKDKDRDTTYQLPSQVEQNQPGENYFYLLSIKTDSDSEKQRQIKTTLLLPFPFLKLKVTSSSLTLCPPTLSSTGRWGMGAVVSPSQLLSAAPFSSHFSTAPHGLFHMSAGGSLLPCLQHLLLLL